MAKQPQRSRMLPSDPDYLLQYFDALPSDDSEDDFDGYLSDDNAPGVEPEAEPPTQFEPYLRDDNTSGCEDETEAELPTQFGHPRSMYNDGYLPTIYPLSHNMPLISNTHACASQSSKYIHNHALHKTTPDNNMLAHTLCM